MSTMNFNDLYQPNSNSTSIIHNNVAYPILPSTDSSVKVFASDNSSNNVNMAPSLTMETLLAYTTESAKYHSDSRRSSYLQELQRMKNNKKMTRIVMSIGLILLAMSIILVGITLSLSDHIDKQVKQTHLKYEKELSQLNETTSENISVLL